MRTENVLLMAVLAACVWSVGCQTNPGGTTATPGAAPSVVANTPVQPPQPGQPQPPQPGPPQGGGPGGPTDTSTWTSEKVQRDLQGHYDFMRSGVMNRDPANFMNEFDETYQRKTEMGIVLDRKETEKAAGEMLNDYTTPTWSVMVKECRFKDDVATLTVERSFSGTSTKTGATVSATLLSTDTWSHKTGSWKLVKSVVTKSTGELPDPGKAIP